MDANLQKYLAFVKAVEYKSFTKAALALNYSQSGISRMISDLEKDVLFLCGFCFMFLLELLF